MVEKAAEARAASVCAVATPSSTTEINIAGQGTNRTGVNGGATGPPTIEWEGVNGTKMEPDNNPETLLEISECLTTAEQ